MTDQKDAPSLTWEDLALIRGLLAASRMAFDDWIFASGELSSSLRTAYDALCFAEQCVAARARDGEDAKAFARQMQSAERAMEKYHDALQELADEKTDG